MTSFFPQLMVPECKPEWNREATTVFSRLPSLRRLQAIPLLQPSLRYPHLSESIFNKIDNLTLNICRRMSTIWCGFIDEQRSTWIRTLQKHVKNFEESPETWKKVVQNTPFEIIKQLALTGKSLLEALILVSSNPQYDFIFST